RSTTCFIAVDVFVLDIAARVHVDGGLVGFAEGALDLAGGTHYQAARGNGGALGEKGSGGNDAAFAYDDAVQDGGAHTDQAAGVDGATVQGDRVAYGDVVAQDERVLVFHDVENRAVLNVGA